MERLSFEGWTDVEMISQFDDDTGVLTIEIGQAVLNICSDVVFVNIPDGLKRKSKRILKEKGIQVGERLPLRNIQSARKTFKTLQTMDGSMPMPVLWCNQLQMDKPYMYWLNKVSI